MFEFPPSDRYHSKREPEVNIVLSLNQKQYCKILELRILETSYIGGVLETNYLVSQMRVVKVL